MSICSISLEPKSQLTINLALKRKQKKKAKRENSQSKSERKQKREERKFPIKDQNKNKRNMQKGLWTRQYLNNTELSPSKQEKERKPRPTVVLFL